MRVLKQSRRAAALGFSVLLGVASASGPVLLRFSTPEAAATTLLQAFKNNDTAKLEAMFGREVLQEVATGDPTSDRRDRQVVAAAMEQSWHWAAAPSGGSELIIGDEKWPFPVPLVKKGSKWQFDSEAGKEEFLVRRIGRNELNVIRLCRAIVEMQRDYASKPHDGKPAGLFAQKLRSSAGRQDGLYWPKQKGQPPSPLGDVAAQAAVTGYEVDNTSSAPFWGYYFRVLTGQGDAAPGGRKSYLVNGEMPAGFALLAYPATYGSSGVMTFVVNQDGVVYEKDLGQETPTLASRIKEYNPDSSWRESKPR